MPSINNEIERHKIVSQPRRSNHVYGRRKKKEIEKEK